jgi:hypothetical protein
MRASVDAGLADGDIKIAFLKTAIPSCFQGMISGGA